jgi:site-specific recombinase XerD
MINEGVDLATLMKLMGHKTIQTTLRYAHLCPRLIHEAIDRVYKNHRQSGPDWDQNSENQSHPQETNE